MSDLFQNASTPTKGAFTSEAAAHASEENLLDWAWTILANAGGGDWTKESKDWQEAVVRWRDAYHKNLSSRRAAHASEADDYVGINKIVKKHGEACRMAVIEAYELGKAPAHASEHPHANWCQSLPPFNANCNCGAAHASEQGAKLEQAIKRLQDAHNAALQKATSVNGWRVLQSKSHNKRRLQIGANEYLMLDTAVAFTLRDRHNAALRETYKQGYNDCDCELNGRRNCGN